MTSNSIGIFAIVIFILAAFGVGGFLIGEKRAPQKDIINTYIVAAPSNGPLHSVVDISLSDITKKTASARFEADSVNIKTATKQIILINAENEILPFAANIESVDTADKTLTIKMPILDDDQIPVRGQLITRQNYNAKRLPLSALQTDDKENYFIWKAGRSADKPYEASITKLTLFNPMRGEHLFDAGNAVRSSDFIILNPDTNLQEGQTIKIDIGDFPAPLRPPIEQAYFEYIEDQKSNSEIELCLHPSLECKK